MIKEKLKQVRRKVQETGLKAKGYILPAFVFASSFFPGEANAGNGEANENAGPGRDVPTNVVSAPAAAAGRSDPLDTKAAAELLVETGLNTIENFDVAGHKFSAEELGKITPCGLGEEICSLAKKNAKKTPPKPGEQTYCLAGVKKVLAAAGIDLDASSFAYNAVEKLQNHPEFVEIACDMKDFASLPDGAVYVWEKGSRKAQFGHIGVIVGGKDYSDYCYSANTTGRRGNGDRYGQPHVFVLKSSKIDPALCEAIPLKDSARDKLAQNGVGGKTLYLDFAAMPTPSGAEALAALKTEKAKPVRFQPVAKASAGGGDSGLDAKANKWRRAYADNQAKAAFKAAANNRSRG